MRHRLLIAGLVAAWLLAGCGGSGSSSSTATTHASTSSATTSSSPASGAGHLTVDEKEFKIIPATARIASTGTITITVKNVGTVTHALSVQTPSGVVSTGHLSPGASATLTLDLSKAGSYLMYCPIDSHRQLGMQGTLIVGSGSGAASGGAAAPSGGSGTSSTRSAPGTPSTTSSAPTSASSSSTTSSSSSSNGTHPPSGGSGY